MGFLRRIADRLDPLKERRSADPSWAALQSSWGGAVTADGHVINPKIAESLAAYSACINAISGAVASFPIYLYKRSSTGRAVDDDHPIMRIIREGPNDWQSWPDFCEMLVAETLANGNGLAEIVPQISDRRLSLKIHPWRNVSVVLLKSGRLAYDVSDSNSLYGGMGAKRRLLDSEVFHLRDRSDDGLLGRSRLSRSAATIRAGLAQEEYGAHIYENQAAPSGLLSIKGEVSPENLERLIDQVEKRWAGVTSAGRVAVLTRDSTFQPLNITPENLEMLAARRFSVEEIARLFQVPPPIIGDYTHNTFTNSQSAGRWFGQFTLQPWVRKLEEGIRRSLLTTEERNFYDVEFDMTSLLRADPEARWQAHEIAVRNNILTANEVREIEGWNPRPEIDQMPSNTAEGIG